MPERGGILMYESALDAHARAKLRAMGGADILIGIPSHRNGRTIGDVGEAIATGIRNYYADKRFILVNADGGSSDNTVRHLQDVGMPDNVRSLYTVYDGPTGKGTAVRAIFEAAAIVGAKACLVLEARVPGITPEWLPALIEPILGGDEITLPCYQRSAYGASMTDNLAYPLMRVFCGTDLREPVPHEYCLAGKLAGEMANMDVWETDVARYGVNVWMAMQALTGGYRLGQVALGFRGDCSGAVGATVDTRFLHTAGILFRILATEPDVWASQHLPRRIPLHGSRCDARCVQCPESPDAVWQAGLDARVKYEALWQSILMPETYKKLLYRLDEADERHITIGFWARMLLEFAIEFNQGEGDPDKVIEALLPIYYFRTASYMRESNGMTDQQRDRIVGAVCRALVELKPFGQKRWESYDSWEIDETTYWLT